VWSGAGAQTPKRGVQKTIWQFCAETQQQWWTWGWGLEARLKKGPLMTSSYSANRDKTLWSSLGRRYDSPCFDNHFQ